MRHILEGGPSMKKVIFHIDVNSAFLSWEAADRKRRGEEGIDLRDIPSAIGGDKSKRHGIILAKSTLAKNFGVKTGELRWWNFLFSGPKPGFWMLCPGKTRVRVQKSQNRCCKCTLFR